MIELKNVNKWYGEYHALNDVCGRVEKGQVLVVCGPSGSGKSTMIRTLNRLENIQKGDITVNGASIYDPRNDLNKLRASIGFVFQQFNLFPHYSVRENVTLSARKVFRMPAREADELAESLLAKVGRA